MPKNEFRSIMVLKQDKKTLSQYALDNDKKHYQVVRDLVKTLKGKKNGKGKNKDTTD